MSANEKMYDDLHKSIQKLEYDLSIREQIDKTLLFLSQHGWENPRESFFHALARFLAETLQMDYVCIDKLQGDLLEAETLAIYFDGQFEDNVAYTLKETPCGDVVGKTICCFPHGVRHLFKNDIVLQDMLAESYVGTTLFNSKSEPIGLIAVIGRQALKNSHVAETILKFAAVRASGELERMNAENALKENEKKLKELNATKDRLFSVISHDLKNPFNSLLGFSELLLKNIRNYDVDKIEGQIKQINKISKNTYNLLIDLLLWSNTQSGSLHFDPQPVVFKEICDEIIESLKQDIDAKNIQILFFEPQKTVLLADVNMLKTIIRNLLSNAIKYTYPNGLIRIYAEIESDKASIIISDNGIGIHQENMDKLWEISSQFTTPGTANEKGTGFGLVLCKEFVEKHSGKIWVESKWGKGSAFKFTMPSH